VYVLTATPKGIKLHDVVIIQTTPQAYWEINGQDKWEGGKAVSLADTRPEVGWVTTESDFKLGEELVHTSQMHPGHTALVGVPQRSNT